MAMDQRTGRREHHSYDYHGVPKEPVLGLVVCRSVDGVQRCHGSTNGEGSGDGTGGEEEG